MPEVVKYELTLNDLMTDKLKHADGAANHLEGTIGSLQGKFGGLGVAVAGAFSVAAIGAFMHSMIDAGTKVEDATTGLTTLLKDRSEAEKVVTQTMEDAAKTPFAFEGLLSANKALISAGESAIGARQTVLDLGNAIAATGGGDAELQRMVVNLQQIKNVGKATALDIKQFAYAGVNIYQMLADATHKPIEAVKDMDVSYDLLTMALKKAHEQGGIYAGGLENMAGNTSVQLSNLKDGVFNLSVQMFNDLKPTIVSVVGTLGDLVGVLKSGWEWVQKNKDVIYPLAAGLLGAAGAVGVIMLATKTWTGVQLALNAAMNANVLSIIIVSIAAATSAIIYCYNHFATFRAVLWGVWETIKEFGRIVGDIFTGLWHTIHGVFTLNGDEIKTGLTQQASALFDAGKRLGDAFKNGYNDGMVDFAKDQAAATNSNAPMTIAGADDKVGGKIKPKTPETKSTETARAAGAKNVTVTININGGLVNGLVYNVKNMKESLGNLKEEVATVLLSAVNDTSLTAGV